MIWGPELHLTAAVGLTFFLDAFLTLCNLQNSNTSFLSVGDFSLSAEHVAIQQTIHLVK